MADAAGGEEKLSKNELKRRQKAEKKAAEKAEKAKEAAEKAPAAAATDKKKPENAINEEDISPNEYFKIRGAAVEELKQGQLLPIAKYLDVVVYIFHTRDLPGDALAFQTAMRKTFFKSAVFVKCR